ncbi:hypothetical protein HYV74_03075 [Candidatus Uhrbacteria bacterium]|nr:hypothetical protein [Candidatus Uhrbacteria bacterium]
MNSVSVHFCRLEQLQAHLHAFGEPPEQTPRVVTRCRVQDMPWQLLQCNDQRLAAQTVCPACRHAFCTFLHPVTRCADCGHAVEIPPAIVTALSAAGPCPTPDSVAVRIADRDTRATTWQGAPLPRPEIGKLHLDRLVQEFIAATRMRPWRPSAQPTTTISGKGVDPDGTPWLLWERREDRSCGGWTICPRCSASATLDAARASTERHDWCGNCSSPLTIPMHIAERLTVKQLWQPMPVFERIANDAPRTLEQLVIGDRHWRLIAKRSHFRDTLVHAVTACPHCRRDVWRRERRETEQPCHHCATMIEVPPEVEARRATLELRFPSAPPTPLW